MLFHFHLCFVNDEKVVFVLSPEVSSSRSNDRSCFCSNLYASSKFTRLKISSDHEFYRSFSSLIDCSSFLPDSSLIQYFVATVCPTCITLHYSLLTLSINLWDQSTLVLRFSCCASPSAIVLFFSISMSHWQTTSCYMWLIDSGKSLTNNRNMIDPSPVPCGTSLYTSFNVETAPRIVTFIILAFSKSAMQYNTWLLIPNVLSFSISLLWEDYRTLHVVYK